MSKIIRKRRKLSMWLIPLLSILRLHCCVHLHVIDTDGGGNGTDEAYKLLVGVNPHSAMPLGQPARRPQGPEKEINQCLNATHHRTDHHMRRYSIKHLFKWKNWGKYQFWEELPEQELRGVVKAEHVVVIFNIILIEKRVELLELFYRKKQQKDKIRLTTLQRKKKKKKHRTELNSPKLYQRQKHLRKKKQFLQHTLIFHSLCAHSCSADTQDSNSTYPWIPNI